MFQYPNDQRASTIWYHDHPDPACNGQASGVPPIWNPEFFANVMVANGVSWPFLKVEPRRCKGFDSQCSRE